MILDDILNDSIDLIWLKIRNCPNLAYFAAIVGFMLQIEITGPFSMFRPTVCLTGVLVS
jgi:hypothetical protein